MDKFLTFFTDNLSWILPLISLIIGGIAVPFIIFGVKRRSEKKQKHQGKFTNIINSSQVNVYQADNQDITINQRNSHLKN